MPADSALSRAAFERVLLLLRQSHGLSLGQMTQALAIWQDSDLSDLPRAARLRRIVPILATSPTDQHKIAQVLDRMVEPERKVEAEETTPSLNPLTAAFWTGLGIAVVATFTLSFPILFYQLFVEIYGSFAVNFVVGGSVALVAILLLGLWLLSRRGVDVDVSAPAAAAALSQPDLDPALLGMAEALRRHVEVPGRRLNARATLRSTLRNGGMLDPVYRMRRVRPETRFLIERRSLNDHLAHLYTGVARTLIAQGVHGDVHHYVDSPEYLIPEDQTRPVLRAGALGGVPGHQRLVVLGSALGLLDKLSAQISPWISELEDWPNKMVLDPTQPRSPVWRPEEVRLAQAGWKLGAIRQTNMAALPRLIGTRPDHNLLSGRAQTQAEAKAEWEASANVAIRNRIANPAAPPALARDQIDPAAPRDIVICCDSFAAFAPAAYPSNVYRTYRQLLEQKSCRVAYWAGRGSGEGDDSALFAGPLVRFLRLFGSAFFGMGVARDARSIYQFICRNYRPGDRLFFFGADRGAYTARVVVGMIRICGILNDASDKAIAAAYRFYLGMGVGQSPDGPMAQRFRRERSPDFAIMPREEGHVVDIAYIGLWQTVNLSGAFAPLLPMLTGRPSLGSGLHDFNLSSLVASARHAVALDEIGSFFYPVLWANLDQLNDSAETADQYQQLWFPGRVGEIVGTTVRRGISDLTMEWVLGGGKRAGLPLSGEPLFDQGLSMTEPLVNWFGPIRSVFLWRRVLPQSLDELHQSVLYRMRAMAGYRPVTLDEIPGLREALKDPPTFQKPENGDQSGTVG